MYEFGKRVAFGAGATLDFADLSLRYLGPRRVETQPADPHGFVYHDFEAATGKETARVSWSSGTGAFAPVEFTVGGNRYVLELGASILSDRVLAPNELVLWPAGQFRAADLVAQLMSWRSDVALSDDRRDGASRELRFRVAPGEAVVRATALDDRPAASRHFDACTHAQTPEGTNPRVPVPDGLLWANRTAPGQAVLLWYRQTVYEISGPLPLRERVSLARWLAHEMAGESRVEEVADEDSLWLLLGFKALPDLRQLPEAAVAGLKRQGASYRQSVPSPADHACRLHDRTARGYHMVAGGWTEVVNPAGKTRLKLDNLDLHRIERHGQRFTAEQARVLEALP